MKPRRTTKPKDIVARSITLEDSKGRPRILLSAFDEHAVIALYGTEGQQSIQISIDPERGLGMDLHDGNGKVAIALGIRANGSQGLSIMDHRSGMMTLIGAVENSPAHEITVVQHGKVRWTTRKPARKRKPKSSP